MNESPKNICENESSAMTTLSSVGSTMFSLSTYDNRVTNPSFDNKNPSYDYDMLQETGRSVDIDHHYRKATCHGVEYDLHELGLNDSLKSVKNLKSKSSISLPTFSDHQFVVNNKDNCNDEQSSSSLTRTHSMEHAQTFEHKPFIVSNQKSVFRPVPSTSSSAITLPSESSNYTSVAYGVDWSEHARPTAHCWFPYIFNDASTDQPCAHSSCTNSKLTLTSLLLQCELCALIMHVHHLRDSQVTIDNLIPPCRPSFIDNTISENSAADNEEKHSDYDRHFWSCVSVLTKPCVYCNHKSTSLSLSSSKTGRLLRISALNSDYQDASTTNTKARSYSPKMSRSSNGLVCLWCSRGYHRSCWEHCTAEDGKTKCDYGIFRDIIVRPQWLRRSNESSSGFQACLPTIPVTNNSESFHFPYTPVILFVNQYSGGQYGEKVYRQLLKRLNPRQVFLLENDATIINALGIYYSLPNIRICVLGGDGSAGWVLGRLAEVYPSGNNPPVSFCPLGTANDLSLILSWGNHYDPKLLIPSLIRIPYAQVIPIDRWQVDIKQLDVPKPTSPIHRHHRTGSKISRPFQALLNPPKFVRKTNRVCYQNHRALPNTCFINYMSFGLDAAIALEFHDQRTHDPQKFSSPLKNKLMYLNESCKYLSDFSRSKMWSLHSYIRLICDGENLTDAIHNCHTLLIINIPAYAAGTNPWGSSLSTSSPRNNAHQSPIIQKDANSFDRTATSSTNVPNSSSNQHKMYESATLNSRSEKNTAISSPTTDTTGNFERQDFGDGKIEVIGLSVTRMASIHIGCHGNRIAQCKSVRIEVSCPMTAQMDGEPFYLPDSAVVNINYGGQVLVLRNENR